MKTILKLLISSAIISKASAYEPFIDFIFGKAYSDNFQGDFNNFSPSSNDGIFHLRSGESFEIELGIRDNSGLSAGFQSAYKKMAIDEVSLSGSPLSLNPTLGPGLDLWNPNEDFRIDGNFFTMPILAFVGKKISLSDKLSLNLGIAGGYTAIVLRPERDLTLFFEEEDTHVWEIQTKLELDYKISEQISTGISYRYSWHTNPEFDQVLGNDFSIHFLGASVEFSF